MCSFVSKRGSPTDNYEISYARDGINCSEDKSNYIRDSLGYSGGRLNLTNNFDLEH